MIYYICTAVKKAFVLSIPLRRIKIFYHFLVLVLLTSSHALATAKNPQTRQDYKAEIEAYIEHHILDNHDFNIFSYTNSQGEKVYVSIPLLVILWDRDVGLISFPSSKFKHGKAIVSVKGKHYKVYHSRIYQTDAEGQILYNQEGKVTNYRPIDFSITKSVVSIVLVSLLMFWFFYKHAKSYEKNDLMPTGLGRFLEPVILFVRDEIAIMSIGEKHHHRFMSYLLTLFFFIVILNLIGLSPFGINVTGNIAVTFCLAIITFIITNFKGNRNYWAHIFWMPGVPYYIRPVLMPIELLGVFIKPFTLMVRLYANMAAGHIVLMTLISLIFVFDGVFAKGMGFLLSFVIANLKILVAILQAYVFTVLSAVYFGFAVAEKH